MGLAQQPGHLQYIHIINACIYILRDFGNLEKREDAINRLATMPFYL